MKPYDAKDATARRFGRRAFMARLGAGAALAPFIPIQIGHAQAATPKRLIIYWSPNGLLHSEYKPDGTASEFRLKRILQPLEKFRDKMLLLQNLDWQCFFKHPMENSHAPACMSLTATAAKQNSAGAWDATGPSIDQLVAQKLNRPGFHDGLVAGVSTYWPHTRLFYRGAGQVVSGSNNPVELFKRIFGATVTPGTVDFKRTDRQSVIDHVRLELNAVKTRLARADQSRLDAHLDHLRTFEQRLAGAASLSCTPGAGPQAQGATPPQAGVLMLDLFALALKCDAARVASLVWTGPGGAGNMVYDWVGATQRHHDLSHGGRPSPGQPAYESLVKIGRFHAEQLAAFLTTLDSIREGDRTMLDNSVVLWTSEHPGNKVGAEDHDRRDVPFALFGSGGGYFRTGRSVDCQGRPHNELLLSLMHAMGLTTEKTFGDPELCSGPLPGLT